jgi:hypothetical protein
MARIVYAAGCEVNRPIARIAMMLPHPSRRSVDRTKVVANRSVRHLLAAAAALALLTVYGLSTGDLSLANARQMARSAVDFVYATWSTTRSTCRRCTCS